MPARKKRARNEENLNRLGLRREARRRAVNNRRRRIRRDGLGDRAVCPVRIPPV